MNLKLSQLLFTSSCLLASQLASADVTLVSSDGRWSATIKDSGGGAGQCIGLRDLNELPAYQNNVSQTLHYVRLGNNLQFGSALTVRMEDTFSLIKFGSTGSTFSAVLASETSAGVIAMVNGEMVAGDAGGLRVSLSFADAMPSSQPLLSTVVKPFVYVNLNVDGQMISNTGSWSIDHFHQTATNVLTGNTRWFVGRSPVAHASNHDSFMQDTLDGGITELNNISWTGPGDVNTAMSFAQGALPQGAAHTIAYAVGNTGISIPANFGLVPNAGTVGIHSPDNRWGATVRTGLGTVNFGTAGTIDAMFDFNEPIASAQFLESSAYYAAVGTSGLSNSERLSDTFTRLGFFLPSDSQIAFTSVLNCNEYPGLLAIIDGEMRSGAAGGLVASIRYADVSEQSLSVTPLVYADLNADGATQNIGGFATNHFHQQNAGRGLSSSRWFRSDVFGSYASDPAWSLSAAMDSGLTFLSNVVELGPSDIATAFAYVPRLVTPDQPYVIAFAIGNAGISIPPSFVVPTQPSVCPADLDSDGFVNSADLAILLGAWGSVVPGTPADLTGDYAVDAADLAQMLGAWGLCDYPE